MCFYFIFAFKKITPLIIVHNMAWQNVWLCFPRQFPPRDNVLLILGNLWSWSLGGLWDLYIRWKLRPWCSKAARKIPFTFHNCIHDCWLSLHPHEIFLMMLLVCIFCIFFPRVHLHSYFLAARAITRGNATAHLAPPHRPLHLPATHLQRILDIMEGGRAKKRTAFFPVAISASCSLLPSWHLQYISAYWLVYGVGVSASSIRGFHSSPPAQTG